MKDIRLSQIDDEYDNKTIGIILCKSKKSGYGICFRWIRK